MRKSRRKKLKGVSTIVVILILAIVAIGVIFLIKGFGGFGFGGGKGDGEGSGNVSESISESIEESETQTETEPTTEEMLYLDITISENDYIYQNQKLSLDEILTELEKINDIPPIKITDDNASQKAYSKLTTALDEKDMEYIE